MISGIPCIEKSLSIAEMTPSALVAWLRRNMQTSGHFERRHFRTRIFSPLGNGPKISVATNCQVSAGSVVICNGSRRIPGVTA